MLTSYTKPQSTITQNLRNTPQAAVTRLSTLVIGTQYKIMHDDGRVLPDTVFNAAGSTIPYAYVENGVTSNLDTDNYVPDTAGLRLVARSLEAAVSDSIATLATTAANNVIRSTNLTNVAGSTLNTALNGRSVRVGDIVKLTLSGVGNVRRRVVALLPRMDDATVSAFTAMSGNSAFVHATNSKSSVVGSVGDWTDAVVSSGLTGFTVAPYAAQGKKVSISGGDAKLGATVQITVTDVDGDDDITVTMAADNGQTATGVVLANTSTTYSFDLSEVGYTGVVTADLATPAIGDKCTITVQVAGAVFAAVTEFPAANVTPADYLGTSSRRYVVEVVSGGPIATGPVTLRVYDTSGVDAAVSTTLSDAAGWDLPLGTSGLVWTCATSGSTYMVTGDRFVIDIAPSLPVAGQYDGLRLSGSATSAPVAADTTLTSVEVFQSFSGDILDIFDSTAFTPFVAGATNVAVAANLGLPASYTGRTDAEYSAFATGIGTLVLSYRAALKPTATEGVVTLTSATNAVATVGEASIYNDLGRGVMEAMSGRQGGTVYALRTSADTAEAFAVALAKIQSSDIYYALTAVTESSAVRDLMTSHVETMSAPTKKNFRRHYAGLDSPGEYVRLGLLESGACRKALLVGPVSGTTWRATIVDDDVIHGGFIDTDLGSSLVFGGFEDYPLVITEVVSTSEVEVTNASGINPGNYSSLTPEDTVATEFKLYAADTATNTVRWLKEQGVEQSSRRCVLVWSDRPVFTNQLGTSEVLPVKYIAAEIAGLRTALLPQQGLTMTEIQSVNATPGMYSRFTEEQLDEIASAGIMIVTQESPGGEVFIRHQLTTDTDHGLLASEDNVGVVVDMYSYGQKDIFKDYLGKRNVTPSVLTQLRSRVQQLSMDYTKVELKNIDYGPPVLRFFDENGVPDAVTVRQDTVLADHVVVYTKLRVPTAINGIDSYVDVEVPFGL